MKAFSWRNKWATSSRQLWRELTRTLVRNWSRLEARVGCDKAVKTPFWWQKHVGEVRVGIISGVGVGPPPPIIFSDLERSDEAFCVHLSFV